MDITIQNVDIELLDQQRRYLSRLVWKNDDSDREDILWGLVEMLDHICDTYMPKE